MQQGVKDPCVFYIITEGRSVVLRASTTQEMMTWLEAFKHNIAILRTNKVEQLTTQQTTSHQPSPPPPPQQQQQQQQQAIQQQQQQQQQRATLATALVNNAEGTAFLSTHRKFSVPQKGPYEPSASSDEVHLTIRGKQLGIRVMPMPMPEHNEGRGAY